MSEFREKRALVYRGGERHNSQLMTKCVTRELFKYFGFHRRLFTWETACIGRLFNGAEVLALPSGDPDYERSSGTPLLRCSVQGF